jgi:hypothetical protein
MELGTEAAAEPELLTSSSSPSWRRMGLSARVREAMQRVARRSERRNIMRLFLQLCD